MYLSQKLNSSLNKTLEQTDVWNKNAYIFKLAGAGLKAERSIESLERGIPQRKKSNYVEKMGHDPLTTVRDVGDSFTQIGGSFRANKIKDSQGSLDGGSISDILCQDSLLQFNSRKDLRDVSLENNSFNDSFEKRNQDQNQ